ncbi:MAG: hypothetical protein ACLU99_13575 [Alphaproteobacteria bacterium]
MKKVSGAAEQQGEKTAVGTEAGTDAGKTPAEQAEGAEPQARIDNRNFRGKGAFDA